MKIAVSVLTADILRNITGSGRRAQTVFETLEKKYDVTLIARSNETREHENIIIVRPAKTKIWNLKLIPIIMTNRFDLIYCVGDYFGFLTYYIFSKICGYRIIFEGTDIPSENIGMSEKKNLIRLMSIKFRQTIAKFAAMHADKVIAVSRDIVEFYGKYNRNSDLVPLFVDEDVFKKSKVRYEHETEKDFKRLGLLGPFNIPANKRYLDFLYSNLDRFDNRINFVIIGKCDDKIKDERIIYTDYLCSIQDYIDQMSFLDAVLAVHKPMDPGPYTKIIESMSCSLPVFTTPQGIAGLENLEPGRDILVFQENEIVDKVNELIFDYELMKGIGRNARIMVEKYYSKKVNEKKLVDILESLADPF